MLASRSADAGLMGLEPLVGELDPFRKRGVCLPAEGGEPGDVEELTWLAVRLRSVEQELPLPSHYLGVHPGKFADGDVGAYAHVNGLDPSDPSLRNLLTRCARSRVSDQ
jgi:hypothetical protein